MTISAEGDKWDNSFSREAENGETRREERKNPRQVSRNDDDPMNYRTARHRRIGFADDESSVFAHRRLL